MCNCMTEIAADKDGAIKAHLAKRYRVTVKEANIKEFSFPLRRDADGSTRLACVTCSTLRVESNERKKFIDVTIMHTFCPFCGVKYD